MKKRYAFPFVTALGGLFVLALLVLFAPALINTDLLKQALSQYIYSVSGRTAVFDGDVRLTLVPVLGFECNNATLSQTAGFASPFPVLSAGEGAAPMLSVGKARVEVRLLPLFSRRVEFKAIELNGVMVSLQRARNGTLSVGGFGGQETPGGPENASAAVGDWTFSFTPSGLRAENFGLNFHDLQRGWTLDIRQGTVAVVEGRETDSISLSGEYAAGFEGRSSIRSVQGSLELTGRGEMDHLLRRVRLDDVLLRSACLLEDASGEKVDGEFSIAGAWNSRTGDFLLREVSLKAEGLQASLNGAGRVAEQEGSLSGAGPEIDGEFRLKAEKPAVLLRRFGLRPPRALQEDVTLHSRFSANASAFGLSDFSGTIGGTTFSASAYTQWLDTPWTAVDLRMDRLDLNQWTRRGGKRGRSASPAVRTGVEAGRPLRDVLRRLNLDLLCHAGEVRMGNVRASNATLDVSAHEGLLQVRKLAADFAKGRLSSSLRMHVFENTLSVQGNLGIHGTSLARNGMTQHGNSSIFSARLAVDGRVDSYRGSCDIARFKPSDIIHTFGLDFPKLAAGKTWRPVSATFDFEGTNDSFLTRSAQLVMNGDILTLDLDVVGFSQPDITFSVKTRQVDLDKLSMFFSTLGAGEKSASAADREMENLTLPHPGAAARIKGRVRLDEVRVAGESVRNVDLAVDTGEDGRTTLRFNARAYGGTLALNAVRNDAEKGLDVHVQARDLDAQRLGDTARRVLGQAAGNMAAGLPEGRVGLEARVAGRGETLGRWLTECAGRTDISFAAGSPTKAAAVRADRAANPAVPSGKTRSDGLNSLAELRAFLVFAGQPQSTWEHPAFSLDLRGRATQKAYGNKAGSLDVQANATAFPDWKDMAASFLEKGKVRLVYAEGAINAPDGKKGRPKDSGAERRPLGIVVTGDFSLDGKNRVLHLDQTSATALGLHLDASARLDYGRTPLRATGTFALNDFNPRELVKSLGGGTFRLKDDTALRTMGLAATFDWRAGHDGQAAKTVLEDLHFVLDQTELEGNVEILGLRWPKIKTRLTGNEFHYNRYLPAPNGMLEPVVYPLEAIGKLDIEAGIKMDSLTIYSMTFTDCTAKAVARNGRLAVTDTVAMFKGGRVTGSVSFQAKKDELAFSTEAQVRGFQMGGMLEEMAGQDYIRGKGDFSLNLTGHGPTNLDLLQTLSGWAALTLGSGAYNFSSQPDAISPKVAVDYDRFRSRGNFGQPERKNAWTHFSKGSISIKVLDGIATSDDLYLNEPVVFSATGNGFCDLYLEYLDYTLTVQYLNTATIPVRMVGPWDDVKVGVSALGALQATGTSIFKDILSLPVNIFKTFLPQAGVGTEPARNAFHGRKTYWRRIEKMWKKSLYCRGTGNGIVNVSLFPNRGGLFFRKVKDSGEILFYGVLTLSKPG